jgi:hypothetical protein
MNRTAWAGARAAAPLLAAAAVACALPAPAAHAARPFDGTDAAVAEPGIFELEFGAGYLRDGAARSRIGPAAVANFGLAGDSELVIEGRMERQSDFDDGPRRSSMEDAAISFKHVWRRGSLQDGSGASIASECALLLPALHGAPGSGAGCAAIVSQRWAALALHINGGLAHTREHSWNRSLGVIVTGPDKWALKPVMELTAERDSDGSSKSVLIGAIWRYSEELAFDLGLRGARAEGRAITEARVGLTWSFPLHR